MKHCCTPKSQDNHVFHDFLGEPCIEIALTHGNTQGNIIHHVFSLKNTPKAFSLPSKPLTSPPPPPPTSPCRQEIPSHCSHLVVAWHKVPFSDIVALPYSDPSWSTVIGVSTATKWALWYCWDNGKIVNPKHVIYPALPSTSTN